MTTGRQDGIGAGREAAGDLDSGDCRFWHVLVRDGFRCQLCGTRRNLQVHHIRYRSHCGGDSTDNLLTVCQGCHAAIHSGRITVGAVGG